MSMMVEMMMFVLAVAMFGAFVILLMKKLGIVEWMQIHGDKVTSQLFSCDFCMSFWVSFILSLVLIVVFEERWMITIPFFSTPVTRYLL